MQTKGNACWFRDLFSNPWCKEFKIMNYLFDEIFGK